MKIDQINPGDGLVRVADYIPLTAVHGPGNRFALWLQGCPISCDGCINPDMIPVSGGRDMRVTQITSMVGRQTTSVSPIEGITFMGGEPMTQARAVADILEWMRDNGELNSILFSGFILDNLRNNTNEDIRRVLSMVDVLIDGPYVEKLRRMSDIRGSHNQKIYHLNKQRLINASFDRMEAEFSVDGGDIVKTGFEPNEITR